MGRRDVESALQRLDYLTQREMQFVVARNLEVAHRIDDNVKSIKAVAHSVDNDVKAIREGA